ncbi:hypothetical protein WA026_016039 [Henosepilachna vigintioctopunctata]|uniref:FGGY carbohydrate kinase domain-containing protein n=1 Tax=Henosepilachna vigintioctopunctata TaxID=420089 RepID=A0AAW1U8N4_9CUCU
MSEEYFIGVDVGTGSVRAGLVSSDGKVIRISVRNILTWNPKPGFYEQSSEDIWAACVKCIKEVTSDVQADSIRGIGFDATCSLVCLDNEGKPLSINTTGDNEKNIILWMDHRAKKEADEINQKNHDVLKYVGGKISLEMETPKLLWLKRNLTYECWLKVGRFFDLPDFLTWKATSCDVRSLCSLVCKWTYEVSKDGKRNWNSSYFRDIGLGDLEEDNWRKIGSKTQPPGHPVGAGLSEQAARELELIPGTPVGTSMIDAHAGGLGLMGCSVENLNDKYSSRLCLICGTSTCHMAVSDEPVFSPGIWGPYFSAMIPGMWLNEGGQSATGKLIDHIIDSHPATQKIKNAIGEKHIQVYLTELLYDLAKMKNLKSPTFLTQELNIWPDFHGNRSPIADSTLKGMVCGLTLSNDEEDLALLYMATVQSLSYGTRHILDNLKSSGYTDISSILICGGLSKNFLFTQTQADVVNLPVICPEEPESVILGSAILGAAASGYFGDMDTAIKKMGGRGKVVNPDSHVLDYHNKKYKIFLKMYQHQMEYRNIMNGS